MNCPNCGLSNVTTATVTEWFAYGEEEHAFQATFPVMTCADCKFGWRDYRAEEAIGKAMEEYQAPKQTQNPVAGFSDKVRELLTEHMEPGNEELFREALLILAAEI